MDADDEFEQSSFFDDDNEEELPPNPNDMEFEEQTIIPVVEEKVEEQIKEEIEEVKEEFLQIPGVEENPLKEAIELLLKEENPISLFEEAFKDKLEKDLYYKCLFDLKKILNKGVLDYE